MATAWLFTMAASVTPPSFVEGAFKDMESMKCKQCPEDVGEEAQDYACCLLLEMFDTTDMSGK